MLAENPAPAHHGVLLQQFTGIVTEGKAALARARLFSTAARYGMSESIAL